MTTGKSTWVKYHVPCSLCNSSDAVSVNEDGSAKCFSCGAFFPDYETPEKVKEQALEVIDFLNLKHLSNELAGNLSGGQKKLLELGRTMMVDAKLVLLDEVGAGVNRTLLKDIGSAILRLNKEKGYTFCMIEHDMEFISRLCNPVIVMAEGSVLFEGTSEEVKKNEQVIESYLGRGSKLKDKS